MEILGIGIDLVEVDRIRRMLERHGERFLRRVFTDGEREYCARMSDPAPCYAARFAAKEAVSKAMGTGIGDKLGWLEIDVQRETSGKPWVMLSGVGAETMSALGATGVLLTMSHAQHYATAQAMLVRAS